MYASDPLLSASLQASLCTSISACDTWYLVGNQKCGVCISVSCQVMFCFVLLCVMCVWVFGRIGLGVPACGFGSGLLYTILLIYIYYIT